VIRTLQNLPKKVLTALGVIVGALVIFGLSVSLLGVARDDANIENSRLKSEIARVNSAITTAKVDQEYVTQNTPRYEQLLKGERLVPHTRRVAVLALEEKARAFGLSGMNYSVEAAAASNSLQAAAGQPTSGAYVLSLQDIKIDIKAPLDGAIYRFVDDIASTFPGAAVVRDTVLSRGATAKDGVTGLIILSWRTAQAQEKKE